MILCYYSEEFNFMRECCSIYNHMTLKNITNNLLNYVYGDDFHILRAKWLLQKGTVVLGPCNEKECKRLMSESMKQNSFYATEISDGLYEVQFTMEQNPLVYVIVHADCGFDAGIKARQILEADFKNMDVMNEK
jgi:hypothetical protein